MRDSSNCLERRSSGEGPAGCIDHAGAGLADFSDRGKKTGRAGRAGQAGEGRPEEAVENVSAAWMRRPISLKNLGFFRGSHVEKGQG
jgi:hypothetical protein